MECAGFAAKGPTQLSWIAAHVYATPWARFVARAGSGFPAPSSDGAPSTLWTWLAGTSSVARALGRIGADGCAGVGEAERARALTCDACPAAGSAVDRRFGKTACVASRTSVTGGG